ncbi:Spt20 family-domain-containing protein [Multifurca ochricompacta]|uniref:Spt20 family-domain-containing protein n=1 Tax=Multifurca ochricompacta TaxID=376703 RepID=A0AAD4QR46_9AGAM|nr:Spt20 family-domain-containing protein [Multifurca ochricompacta]
MAYNLTRETQSILKECESNPPSFSLQLYHDNWTLNSGPKFLYNSPAFAALFDDIKANRIPIDLLELFDAARVPFYEGCMIVEIEEFKQINSKDNSKDNKLPEKTVTRVLLRPNSETLFADLCLLNQKGGGKWTDEDALEVEAKILLATSPPLCLDPDPRLGKIANSLYRISLPRTPPPLRPKKRKANSLESTEEDEASWNRKAKIIRFMDPKPTRSATPSYRLLDHLKRIRAAPPPPPPENNAAGLTVVNHSNPLHSMPTSHAPAQQPTPQPHPGHTARPLHSLNLHLSLNRSLRHNLSHNPSLYNHNHPHAQPQRQSSLRRLRLEAQIPKSLLRSRQ